LNTIVEITSKYNQIIWEQLSWGNEKTAQLLEESMEEDLR